MTSNESHAKILHENNGITNWDNNNNIKDIKKLKKKKKKDFLKCEKKSFINKNLNKKL